MFQNKLDSCKDIYPHTHARLAPECLVMRSHVATNRHRVHALVVNNGGPHANGLIP